MEDDSDFFGDVFGDPEDDPLLGGADSEASSSGFESTDSQSSTPNHGAPSWMSEERTNGHAQEDESARADSERSESRSTQKTILIDQQGADKQGLDELNESVEQGWRLVRISLSRSTGNQGESFEDAYKFVAVLEQEGPQSLFDFGSA